MNKFKLSGVMPAVTTPFTRDGNVDHALLIERCAWLLSNGCDGINLLGTTGEGTSLSVRQRLAVMQAISASGLPLSRLMISTGASALEDAQVLTAQGVELGFAGVLLLPPFYFKGISEDGIVSFIEAVLNKVDVDQCRLYLYHMPAYTGVPYTPTIALRLKEKYGDVIAGLKDSTGDLSVSSAFVAAVPDFDVFPSSESSLGLAKERGYAGCISATVNVTAPLAGKYWNSNNDAVAALEAAAEIRLALQSLPLLPAVKWAVARTTSQSSWLHALPPIGALSASEIALIAPVLEKHWESIKVV
ncbi:dihydrodipicolinate synthase family protein [Glaciimonas sp. PCH181]|uniref:dihydrodipicolinate synthase family protein n=1 Tax=Glaciimonas sp. PCH181 TaxID=2133943 RepID=UPI000D38D9A6|nr:dihydrodipicolinate synthase family protein [Glaciimonas sp. PCH181]PUA18690.1 dihydrodipicolinate synthase family protein [Glaciimonas sp. PCH181]